MTLEILISDTLAPLRHGFFTRRGGASTGVFAGLNCGAGSLDQSDIVSINRSRVAHALAVPPQALVSAHQVHSTTVLTSPVPRCRTGRPMRWSPRRRAWR
jgi:polyphenol oxidase